MMRFRQALTARAALIVLGVIGLLALPAARAAEGRFRCTNTFSAAIWDVTVDYERGTVDSYPAKITAMQISWHDTLHGGYYYLDRASGDLRVVVASSTGGYEQHHKCHPS